MLGWLKDNVVLAIGVIALAASVGIYVRTGSRLLAGLAIGGSFTAFIIVRLWHEMRKFVGPNGGICHRCGGRLQRGPLGVLIDPAPHTFPDELLLARFGYVWACRKCGWTDRRE